MTMLRRAAAASTAALSSRRPAASSYRPYASLGPLRSEGRRPNNAIINEVEHRAMTGAAAAATATATASALNAGCGDYWRPHAHPSTLQQQLNNGTTTPGQFYARRSFASSAGQGVTVTQTPGSDNDGSDAKDAPPNAPSSGGGGGSAQQQQQNQQGGEEPPGGPSLKTKSPSQQAEEHILELQTHVRTHHRHAAYHSALTTSQTLLEACLAHFGETHPATASAYNNLGLMHKMLGEFADSRTNYTQALDLYGTIVGKDHASYAAALNNLGNLDRAQSTMDEELDARGRLELNESAVRYFDEALGVRLAELGDEHPNTVTSRTNLGGALAALVLQRHAFAAAKAGEDGAGGSDGADLGDSNEVEVGTTPSTTVEDDRGWEAAEDHLRTALRTAISNPRGKKFAPPSAANAASQPIGKKRDRSKSKKERIKDAKIQLKQRKEEAEQQQQQKDKGQMMSKIQQALAQPSTPTDDADNLTVQTLSAASAAQNLAVFLKSRADVLSAASTSSTNDGLVPTNLDRNDMYAESRRLYESALRVRSALREGEHHPDVVATKFSLAELLATLGDEDGADALRKEILDAYDVTEKDAEEVEKKE